MMILHTKSDPIPIRAPRRVNLVDAAPFGRLLRALIREGYTLRALSDRTKISRTELRHISLDFYPVMFASTAGVLRPLSALLPSESVSA